MRERISRRFFVPDEVRPGIAAILSGQDARHIVRALRLGEGDEIEVVDGAGREYRARIVFARGERVEAMVVGEVSDACREPSVFITVLQGLPKADKMDEVVRRNTEIGVARFAPVITERSVTRPDVASSAARVERWKRIAREASRQAGRQRVPEVRDIVRFREALAWAASELERDGKALFLVPWELERTVSLRQALRERQAAGQVLCLVGPEGGLSHAEVEDARKVGAVTCSLGPRILRTETAALVVCSVILYEAGEMG